MRQRQAWQARLLNSRRRPLHTMRPYLAVAAAAAWAPLLLLLPRMNRTWSTSALKL